MSDAPKKRPGRGAGGGRPKRNKLSPSRRDRLIAAGTYDEYKQKVIRTRKVKTLKEAGLPEVKIEALLDATTAPDVVAEIEQDLAVERTKVSVAHAVRVEMAKRELARRKLIHYTLRNLPNYDAGWIHIEIAEKLEQFLADVVAGKSPRLCLFMPPRHGKTELIRQFVSWALGQHPHFEFICCSYGAQLQEENSGKIQNAVRSPEWQALFPHLVVDKKHESFADWKLARHGGGVLAVGVGGAITGRGANVLIIDDPVKNREEADSEVMRAGTWNWYTSTAFTRLMPGAGVLVIQTRWHDDDLSGRIMQSQIEALKEERENGTWPEDVERWTVIEYPAIAVEDETHRMAGEALHPTRYPLSALNKIKRTIGPRDWSALYQQNPVADEGAYFNKNHPKFFDTAPEHLAYYAAADLAISKKESADYSVIVVVGIDPNDDMYVVDLQRGRWDSNEIIDRMIDIYRRWKPKTFGVEAGQIEKAIGPFLQKRIGEEKLYSMYVEPLPPGKRDKPLRARPLQGRLAQGKVYFQKDASWVEGLIHEMLRFPNGVHDDQVDALAWIGQMLDVIHCAEVPKPKPRASWRDQLNKLVSSTGSRDPMAA